MARATSTQVTTTPEPIVKDSFKEITLDLFEDENNGKGPSPEQLAASENAVHDEKKTWNPDFQGDLRPVSEFLEYEPNETGRSLAPEERKVLPRVDSVMLGLSIKSLAFEIIQSISEAKKQEKLIDLLPIKQEYKDKILAEVQSFRGIAEVAAPTRVLGG